MKEIKFIRHNLDKWERMETVVKDADFVSPDKLADTYTELTADLSFAQTNYPDSRITIYLNNLTSALHNQIYRNKKEKWSRLYTFWTREVPDAMYESRRALLVSFIVFVLASAIGYLSGMKDPEYVRQIMGDGYVDMTIHNIQNGDPVGVYGSSSENPMFLEITFNNVMVSFRIFISGLLTFFGTGYILIYNGVMIGAFQAMLHQYGVWSESMLAVFLHGNTRAVSHRCCRSSRIIHRIGMAHPRELQSYGRIQAQCAKWNKDYHWYSSHIHSGRFYRKFHYPSYRAA